MPDLDITELFTDPDLSSTFDIKRRSEVVDPTTGRPNMTIEVVPNVQGFVISIEPTNNTRTEDSQMTSRAIEVCTVFPIRAASEGVQPDVIVYDGIDYTVTKMKSHRKWGAGWVKVEAESMNASDTPEEVLYE